MDFARKHQIAPLALGDALALFPIGLGLGRLGNFIGGELWGRPTDLPWAMVFLKADELARHPSQLYQFALEGVSLFVVLWLFSSKPRRRGQVTGLFLLGYGVFRFMVEFVREPDSHLGFIALNWMTMDVHDNSHDRDRLCGYCSYGRRRRVREYLDLLQLLLDEGTVKSDRTGTGTLSRFGHQMRFDLNAGFSPSDNQKVHLKSVIHELLWFMRGDTNTQYLRDHGVSIWDEWAYRRW